MNKTNINKITITAICIALCVVLPYVFHFIPNAGQLFSPMHIPVLLCGLVTGPLYGLATGVFGPLLSSLLTGMPPTAFLPNMMIELALYGLIAGLMMRIVHTGKLYLDILISLIVAMLLGRVFIGIVIWLFLSQGDYGISAWFAAYFTGSIPGIIAHIIIIPIVTLALIRANLVPNKYEKSTK